VAEAWDRLPEESILQQIGDHLATLRAIRLAWVEEQGLDRQIADLDEQCRWRREYLVTVKQAYRNLVLMYSPLNSDEDALELVEPDLSAVVDLICGRS